MNKKMMGALAAAVVLATSGPAWSLSVTDVGDVDTLDSAVNLANSGQQLQDLGYFEVADSNGDHWVDVTGESSGDLWAFYFDGNQPTTFVVKTGENTSNTLLGSGEYDAFFYTNLTMLQYAVIDISQYYFTTGGGPGGPQERGIEIERVSHVNATTSVPEPGTLLLLGSGLLGLGLMRRRKHAA